MLDILRTLAPRIGSLLATAIISALAITDPALIDAVQVLTLALVGYGADVIPAMWRSRK
jgi:uncharacterized membrane protein YccF (DUF307 family)